MATQGPTEYSNEEEHSFSDRIRYCRGSPVQAHMLRSFQIAIVFAPGCKIQHRFESKKKEKKFRDMAEASFRIMDEDLEDHDICNTETQLRYA